MINGKKKKRKQHVMLAPPHRRFLNARCLFFSHCIPFLLFDSFNSGCEGIVESALKNVDGVLDARCPFRTRLKSIATVHVSTTLANDDSLIDALAEMGKIELFFFFAFCE
jgi:hypothetical protein